MNLFSKGSLSVFLIVYLMLSPLSGNAQQIDPKEILVTVTNVPVNKPSIFVPITVSSEELDLYRVALKDVIFQGYIASIEKDDNGKVVGISFADIKSKTLPETLTAVIKLRLKKYSKSANKDSEATLVDEDQDSQTKNIVAKNDQYPMQVSVRWDAPWVFTKPTKNIEGVYAGFNSLTFASKDISNIDERHRKKIIEQSERKNRDFYVKSLGQTVIRSKRQSRRKKETNLYKQPIIRELTFFASTPDSPNYGRLYVPLVVAENQDSLKISPVEQNWQQGVVTRVLDNNVLELSSADPGKNLPANALLKGTVKIEQRFDSLIEELKVGPVLSEPSESVSGVRVTIEPSTVFVGNKPLNPLNLFKID